MRNVTKPTDATGQPTDEGREARRREADEPVWSMKSAERIMRLLRSKRSFRERRDQKSEYVTHCHEQLCEQESGQARQMDRGEIEVEEERRVRAKRVPVLPTDKENDESEIMNMTSRSQCETEDSHKCSPKESPVPRVTTDRRSFAHVCADSVSILKIHSAVEACQVPHETSETRAVTGVLENLVTSGLGEVLLKRDVGSAIRMLVNPAWSGQGEKMMAVKSSRYSRRSSNTSENAVKVTETTVTASDCVLPEWFGCKVENESIAPSRIVGCAAHVLSQSEKRSDDHNVRVRLRTRRSRAELMLKSETVNPKHVRGEMAKLNPSKATETFLDSTNRDDERLPHRRENNGSEMHSQTSQVCPGIQENWRGS